MRAPNFWQTKNWRSRCLYPLACIYAAATKLRLACHKPFKAEKEVICIGNLTAGGSGKTPTAAAVAEILQQAGKHPFFISRGYGGRLSDVRVDLNIHSAQEVGDEPLLLARTAPVVVNHRRDKAALKAIAEGADVLIMDDGFQNPYLFKDKSLLVVDGAAGLGNMMPIPSGPLREFVQDGMKRAQGMVILGEDKHNIAALAKGLPIFYGRVEPQRPQIVNRSAVAFAGIGRPEKFFASLEECGIEIVRTWNFPDNHFYSEYELNEIISAAEKEGAEIFTTSKDMVKIPQRIASKFNILEIKIKWKDEEKLKRFLLE